MTFNEALQEHFLTGCAIYSPDFFNDKRIDHFYFKCDINEMILKPVLSKEITIDNCYNISDKNIYLDIDKYNWYIYKGI